MMGNLNPATHSPSLIKRGLGGVDHDRDDIGEVDHKELAR